MCRNIAAYFTRKFLLLPLNVVLMLTFVGLSAAPNFGAYADDAHEHHHHDIDQQSKYSIVDLMVPELKLVRADGKVVSLANEIIDARPVILSFIFTTCTTICPLTSQILAQLQGIFRNSGYEAHILCISIDPEQDTPDRLTKYANKFGAGSGWQHYTGSVEASISAQRAFNAYQGDKMNHTPVIFLRAQNGNSWLRVDGFAKADDIFEHYKVFSHQNLSGPSIGREPAGHSVPQS
jgi:protein SCO1